MGWFRGGYAEGTKDTRRKENQTRRLFIQAHLLDEGVLCRKSMNTPENTLAHTTIGLAMKVHSHFGPGLLESAYRECLAYELRKLNHDVHVEKSLPLVYEDVKLNHGYRVDMVVDNRLVVEIKSVDALLDVHFAQLMTYLKVGDYRLGLLLNFKVAHLRDGIKRVANKL